MCNRVVANEIVKEIILEFSDTQFIAVICPSKDVARDLEARLRDDLSEHYRETQVSERRDLCRPYFVHFTDAYDVKGLEFYTVIVPFFEQYDLTDFNQANAAYVAVSRPRYELYLLGEQKSLNACLGK